ncbi:cytochrome P450 [Xylaria sp. FL1042]|nr:cytochrome P450 [Xylaria sp. FL1042]
MLNLIVFAGATLLASYLYFRLRYIRYSQYAHIPQLPNHLLWGHLKIFGELASRGIRDRHPDRVFEEMWQSIGRPPVMLVDLRPINPPMLLVTAHDVAEQISKPSKLFPHSTPKSPTLTYVAPIIGDTSILSKNGGDWKNLRKRFNPGFSIQHLWKLLPLILEKTGPFCAILDKYSETSETFPFETLVSNLTLDIIGVAVMEIDLKAQDSFQQGELIRLMGQLTQTYLDDKANSPWWIVPITTVKRYRLSRRIDSLIKETIQRKYSRMKQEGQRSRSILALSLQDRDSLTAELLSETADQVRSFLFAGHDTNTSTLEWTIYELSRTPRAIKAIREELNEVLGTNSDSQAICAILAERGEQLLPKLGYLNAVIKETLRLHPPGGTARMSAPGSGFTVSTAEGEELLVDGTVIYSCPSIIHRDRNAFGDTADDWVPERWLGDAANGIPASAYRPFERGPRSCIGIELANLEPRIIIALIARRYDVTKVGLGESLLDEKGLPVINEKGQFRTKSDLYNTRRITSQPVDGTMMKVGLAS